MDHQYAIKRPDLMAFSSCSLALVGQATSFRSRVEWLFISHAFAHRRLSDLVGHRGAMSQMRIWGQRLSVVGFYSAVVIIALLRKEQSLLARISQPP
jgi:hypothetical protein